MKDLLKREANRLVKRADRERGFSTSVAGTAKGSSDSSDCGESIIKLSSFAAS